MVVKTSCVRLGRSFFFFFFFFFSKYQIKQNKILETTRFFYNFLGDEVTKKKK